MDDQLVYLGRTLDKRATEVASKIDQEIEGIMRRNAAAGRLGSGSTLISFNEEAQKLFIEAFESAALFSFNLTHRNGEDVGGQLSYFADRAVDAIMGKIMTSAVRLGLPEQAVAPHVTTISTGLINRKECLLDDFKFGMLGNARMKSDPLVNIVTHQTNSPGAIQQIGMGTFSQSAFSQHNEPLLAAIDAALISPEFSSLNEIDKEAFRDVADIMKAEARKPQPDPQKLKRWSDRLVAIGKELGMRVVVSEIAQVLAKIFGA